MAILAIPVVAARPAMPFFLHSRTSFADSSRFQLCSYSRKQSTPLQGRKFGSRLECTGAEERNLQVFAI